MRASGTSLWNVSSRVIRSSLAPSSCLLLSACLQQGSVGKSSQLTKPRTIGITPGKLKALTWAETCKISRDYTTYAIETMANLPREHEKPFRFLYVSAHFAPRDPAKKKFLLGDYGLLRVSLPPLRCPPGFLPPPPTQKKRKKKKRKEETKKKKGKKEKNRRDGQVFDIVSKRRGERFVPPS